LYPQPLGVGGVRAVVPRAGSFGGSYAYRDTGYRYPLPLGKVWWSGGGGGGGGVMRAVYDERGQTPEKALVEAPVEGAGGRRANARREEKTTVGDRAGEQGDMREAGPVWSQATHVRAAAARGRGRFQPLASSKLSQSAEPGAEQGGSVRGLGQSHTAAAAVVAGGVARRGAGMQGEEPGKLRAPGVSADGQETALLRNGKGSACVRRGSVLDCV
jgi:hypothetical protein